MRRKILSGNEKEIKRWIKELEKENEKYLYYSYESIKNLGKIELLKSLLEEQEE